MIQIFEELKSINQAGVYQLVNSSQKSCYVSYSSNMAEALTRLLSSDMFFDEYEFQVLELVTDPVNLRIRCQYFKDLLSSNGWVILNPNRVSNWKVVIDLVRLPDKKSNEDMAIAVKVVSRGYKELIVGLFYTHVGMQSFVDRFYARNLVTNLVYADNELTRQYKELYEKVR